MGSIVSATTRATYGATASLSRRDQFLASAETLIAAAHDEIEAGQFDLALENAYRGALRVAGAANADSPDLRKRKRHPSSAWEKLALTGDDGKRWAARFQTYSRTRGRVASGIDTAPDPKLVLRLLADVEEFYRDVHPVDLPLVA
ncbi:hypothetical protein CGLAU_08445 [Corynebacterium glaucum]|mgnify:FL=1|uniref:SAV-6107-like HEPN domain-containing protein n=1 Tax=Corynebacterium glaucum TaxID=187491 RepID=A0A1Q2HXT7_9CORY|nr:SAV_6107 family HEPN domain-containing protein [Corynebacterium glaucum]AQQ15644.1 hypothetical protein CGLAU_08445 [Corynebacterium glaucum]